MVTQINQDTVNKALWSACDVFRGTVSADTYKDYIFDDVILKSTSLMYGKITTIIIKMNMAMNLSSSKN